MRVQVTARGRAPVHESVGRIVLRAGDEEEGRLLALLNSALSRHGHAWLEDAVTLLDAEPLTTLRGED